MPAIGRLVAEFLKLYPEWTPKEAEALLGQLNAEVQRCESEFRDRGAVKLTLTGPRANMAWLSNELRQARHRVCISVEEGLVATSWSRDKFERIELGKVSISVADLRHLINLYKIRGKLAEEMLAAAKATYGKRTGARKL